MTETKVKETTLTNLILKFLKDSNKWVKISSFKQLGPFIYSLSDCQISEKLIEYYCQMAVEESFSENEVNIFNYKKHRFSMKFIYKLGISCAYNFPAVLKAVGVEKWPVLFNTFQALLNKGPEVIIL